MALLNSRVVRLAAASILAGIAIGLVGGLFRYLLARADQLRDALVYRAHAWPYFGWLAPLVFAAVAAALARVLVIRFAPFAAGSGVQHVEAVMTGEMKLSSPVIVPVKFFGGLLALGSGLALGREGPTVQMGASLGSLVSKSLVHADEDRRVVNAAGAGAGLAVAFNAPIGGSVFVFEELTSSFTPWLLVATLAAASVAVWIMRAMLGNELDFTVKHVGSTQSWLLFPFLALGLLLGGVGALYNASTMAMLRLSDRMAGISSVNRAAFIGGAVGLAAWFAPQLVGSGDSVTQAIFSEHGTVEVLLAVFVLRFLIGPWSYAAAAGRPLRPALSAWRRLWCTVRRNLKPPDAHAGHLIPRLRGRRNVGVILGQCKSATNRRRSYSRDDRSRRPDVGIARGISRSDGGRDVAQQRAHLHESQTAHAGSANGSCGISPGLDERKDRNPLAKAISGLKLAAIGSGLLLIDSDVAVGPA